MKAGKYSIKELFVNRHVQQIVIPEIQRDYVWAEDQVLGIINSIKLDFKKFNDSNIPVEIPQDMELQTAFHEFYKKRNLTSNIGFIYAYNDEQYPGRYFLIDGQQRITTMFLVLLALARRNKSCKESFKRTYLIENQSKLDYRVRESSHDFINKLIPFVLDNDEEIIDQAWYYEDYKNDTTINSITANFKLILNYFDQKTCNEVEFYDFLENYTEFWYFDTNVSEQGEELYIYMNARGEQVQANENIKADLLSEFSSIEEKNHFGKKWEDWQDFFWQNRSFIEKNKTVKNKTVKNENADKGYNEFLTCISGLERYLFENEDYFYSKESFEKFNQIKVVHILEPISLATIEKYIKGLQFLLSKREEFKILYPSATWLDKCLSEIFSLFNGDKTNWYADFVDANRATERNRMVFIWPILYFLSKIDVETVTITNVYRLLRIYYLKYHNFNRAVKGIKNDVEHLTNNFDVDILLYIARNQSNILNGNLISETDDEREIKFLSKEEFLKMNFLFDNRFDLENQRKLEMAIWKIEDHKFNIDGSDVGAINISHLVDFQKEINLKNLEDICSKFYESFPLDKNNYFNIQNILLFYGEYWHRVSPWYYFNNEFNNWKKIIRDRDNYNKPTRSVFSNFFNDFIKFDGNLEQFFAQKKEQKIEASNCNKLYQKLHWYNQYLGDEMWEQGNYIAFSNDKNYNALPDCTTNDKVFSDLMIIYNTRGHLNGGKPKELFELLSEDAKNEMKNSKQTELI
jgi:hypothetical protein